MKKVRLGRTGLMVSPFGCGGITLVRMSLDQTKEIVGHCYELGITLYEVGRGYIGSEKKMGQSIGAFRDTIYLASKTRARDAEGAAKDIASSLRNLGTSIIDLYQFHEVNNQEDLEKVLGPRGGYEALDRARTEGKIRYIGISCHNLEVALAACRTNRFDTLQVAFNFIETEAADEFFKVAEDLDIGVIIMKVLGGGILDRADLSFKFLQQYSNQYSNMVPLVGFLKKEEIDEIYELYRSPQPLSEIDWKEIEGIRSESGKKFCHRCEYCQPCEQKVLIPMVMNFRIITRLWDTNTILNVFKGPMDSVDNCIECGVCIEKCPYDLPIPEMIKEYQEGFNEMARENK